MTKSKHPILHELEHHIPFTALASIFAIILTAIFYFSFKNSVSYITSLFYILHPAHILVSSIVSAAMFYKYRKNFLSALLVGISGSILIGSLSDIFMPYLGGWVFQLQTSFHFALIEEPVLILTTALIGSLLGIYSRFTKIPHLIHVFLSVFASLFYLLAFSIKINFLSLIFILIIIFIAVLIPCCISDIVFPLLFVNKRRKR